MSTLAAAGLPAAGGAQRASEMRHRIRISELARPHLQFSRALPVATFHRITRRTDGERIRPLTNRSGLMPVTAFISATTACALRPARAADRHRPCSPWRAAAQSKSLPSFAARADAILDEIESFQAPTRVKMCEGMCCACGAAGAMPAYRFAASIPFPQGPACRRGGSDSAQRRDAAAAA